MNKIILRLLALVLLCSAPVFAQETSAGAKQQEELSLKEMQARAYREEGLKSQDLGDLDSAMELYQKALQLDPAYAVVYNDLGVIYEAKNMAQRAEDMYLRAINIDPYYLSTYSNLALFYEEKRELGKAAYCWKKRAELGNIDDPWTQKARQRLEDIRLSISPEPARDSREKDIVKLMKDVANEKHILGRDDKALASKHFKKAKESYNKGDYATAVKEASDAQYLDPDNKEITEFIETSQRRALSR